MDGLHLWALSIALLLLLLLSIVAKHSHNRLDGKLLPPSPPAWPIIGHLHLLTKMPHQAMAALANAYGPIIYLRLGSKPALFISSPRMARHFLQLHDSTFSHRPPSTFQRLVFHNKSFILMSSGKEWRDIRRICSTIVFHPKLWDSSKSLIMEEVAAMLRAITAQEQQHRPIVDLARISADFMSRTISRLLFTDDQRTKLITDMNRVVASLVTSMVIGDFIPWLGFLDWRVKRKMERIGWLIDSVFRQLMNDRRNESNRQSPPDFLDALISAKEDDRFPFYNTDESIVHTCMDILGAGSETTSTTLEWAMAELLANPNELRRLQEEIDGVVPSQRMVNSMDLESMSYLKAVIKETLRLHPPAPLLVPHASKGEEVEVDGYIIPPNCNLFVNVWAMGRDPTIWEKPLLFYPPRFLGEQSGGTQESIVELLGQQFQFIPFGFGRRRCPGAAIAMDMLQLGLSNLVHAFDWTLPSNMRPEELDFLENIGITAPRLNPLLACPKTRH